MALGATACSDPEGAGGGTITTPNNNPNNGTNNDTNNDTPVCGDGVCDNEEASCPEDCSPPTGCDACGDDQTCVTNNAVTDECFDTDCPGQQCDVGQVCIEGSCGETACAGVTCGDGQECSDGSCVEATCETTGCPDGQDCINDVCLTACEEQSDCGTEACTDGHCLPCAQDEQCGEGLICLNDECLAPCDQVPDRCGDNEICNPDTGRCETACLPGSCPEGQVCDAPTGQCVDGECGENPNVNDCPEGQVCQNHVCGNGDPQAVLGMCAGCAVMESAGYRAIGVLSPVDIVDVTATSDNHILQSGVISALPEPEEQ